MALNLIPNVPVVNVESRDEICWKIYFKRVSDEDSRQITEWQKILDTLLVYVCFPFASTTLPRLTDTW